VGHLVDAQRGQSLSPARSLRATGYPLLPAGQPTRRIPSPPVTPNFARARAKKTGDRPQEILESRALSTPSRGCPSLSRIYARVCAREEKRRTAADLPPSHMPFAARPSSNAVGGRQDLRGLYVLFVCGSVSLGIVH